MRTRLVARPLSLRLSLPLTLLLASLLGTALSVVGGLAAPTLASACSCAYNPDSRELEQQAGVIFTGTVVDRQGEQGGGGGEITYTFSVDRVFKGQAYSLQQVATADSSAACGIEQLAIDKPYLVLTDGGVATAVTLQANLCGGTRPGGAPATLGAGGPPIPGTTGTGTTPTHPSGSPLALPLAIVGGLVAVLIVLGLLARRNREQPEPFDDEALDENEKL